MLMSGRFFPVLAALVLSASPSLRALESPATKEPGITCMQLVTDVSAITPGEPFTVAFVIDPLPGHHTYWRAPGIVGVATTLDWILPAGFTPGKLQWPAPEKVNMAGITAYGYESRTMLLAEIHPAAEIHGDNVEIRAKAAWMACGKTCHPGNDEFSLTIPVNRSGQPAAKDARISAAIEQTRMSVPRPAPDTWKISARSLAADRIELNLSIPGLTAEAAASVAFFCDDNQVDSDQKQQAALIGEGPDALLRITLVRPDCAPSSPAAISGVLHCPVGWPGMDATHVEISAPWTAGKLAHD